jgi:hypothetical protein
MKETYNPTFRVELNFETYERGKMEVDIHSR